MPTCYFCGAEVEIIDRKVGRMDECPSYRRDLHSCMQCRFYDRSYHNQCRENQAQQVADKEKSNFCEFFEFGRDSGGERKAVDDARKKLEEIFRKG